MLAWQMPSSGRPKLITQMAEQGFRLWPSFSLHLPIHLHSLVCSPVCACENLLSTHCSLHCQSYKSMFSALSWAVNQCNVCFPNIPLLSLLFNFSKKLRACGLKFIKYIRAADSFFLLSQLVFLSSFPLLVTILTLHNIPIISGFIHFSWSLLIHCYERWGFRSLCSPFPMAGNFIVLALWIAFYHSSVHINCSISIYSSFSSVFHFLSGRYLLSYCQA